MLKSPSNSNVSKRRRARQMVLQALYQWQINTTTTEDIESQLRTHNDMHHVDTQYFQNLLHNIPECINQLDAAIIPFLDRPLSRLDPIVLITLRIGCYEFLNRKDVPYRVVINEAIELAKCFGAQDSHFYINGILDKLAISLNNQS